LFAGAFRGESRSNKRGIKKKIEEVHGKVFVASDKDGMQPHAAAVERIWHI